MIDYKKKYLDALERANSFQEKYGGDYAGYIFPELRESEDERIRKRLLWFLANYTGRWDYPETRMACRAWLEKQKEQKPAEWSEEDRLHYANVLEALEYVKGCKSDYDKIEAVKSDIAWLKLLRNRVGKEFLQPHWKPSEEQMEALLKAVDKARELHYTSIDGYDGYNELRSLYEQIKKLM